MLLLFQRRTSYPKSIILSTYVAFLNILLRAKAQQFNGLREESLKLNSYNECIVEDYVPFTICLH